MKNIICFILTVVFALSLFGTVGYAITDIRAIGWKKTTLTVTFIGLPDGTAFGDYTDANGQKHENEPALSWPHSKCRNVEQYYGQEITVLCGTEQGDVVGLESLIRGNLIFFCTTVLSAILLYFGFLRKKQQNENTSE